MTCIEKHKETIYIILETMQTVQILFFQTLHNNITYQIARFSKPYIKILLIKLHVLCNIFDKCELNLSNSLKS